MVTLKFKIIFVLLLLSFVFPIPSFIHAAEDNLIIENETINPGSIYYPLKRLWEKASAKIQFNNQSKILFHESLLKKRLVELNYVVENKLLSEVQTSTERFAYQAGILVGKIEVRDLKKKESIIQEFKDYNKYLEKLRDHFEANSSFWMLVQHDINTLKILADQIK